jgi:F-type H+-transporting ATPase subunit b
MDLNATLIGQMITFALFVCFTMKFIWPVLEKILQERQEKISAGLAAAERGHKELELAQKYAIQHIHEAKAKASETIEQAKKQAAFIVEQAKQEAAQERAQIVSLGHEIVEQERRVTREELQNEVINLALASAEKLLGRVMTENDHKALLNAQTKFRNAGE